MSTRQTKSFLMQKLQEIGVEPATRHGQNFLIDLNLLEMIVDTAEIDKRDVVLEVGTGTGSLTSLMAPKAAEVITAEIDGHLFELASEELLDHTNVTALNIDALKNKNQFSQELLATIEEKLAHDSDRRLKLVANLPYNVATPILSNLLLTDFTPHTMVATIQKELADRIVAQPWTKDYSALSVWIQSQCQAEIVRIMPPSVFWPAPKVHSAIIKLVVDPSKRAEIPDLRYFHQFVKAIFLHRRKFLRANIVAAMKAHLSKEQIDVVLEGMQLTPDTRTEQLAIATLLELTERIRALAPDWKL